MIATALLFRVDSSGRLHLPDGRTAACVLGRGGMVPAAEKREGDGASPAGRWPMRRVFYRPDREAPPLTALERVPLRPRDGWCDDPSHPLYNRAVTLPIPASHEVLWRDDHVYDLIIELGHNDDPPVPGLGSAIFMHLTRPDRAPTEGCVALDRDDLLEVLRLSEPGAAIRIG